MDTRMRQSAPLQVTRRLSETYHRRSSRSVQFAIRQGHFRLLNGPTTKSGLTMNRTIFHFQMALVSQIDGGANLAMIVGFQRVMQFNVLQRQLTGIV
mmetsp:Transcript_73131/g.110294  ORF Transcript_73131/g.110294 Transcript_73131/m.110294 type:complete len:97 (+) Transcript_73131:949-1239(+)